VTTSKEDLKPLSIYKHSTYLQSLAETGRN